MFCEDKYLTELSATPLNRMTAWLFKLWAQAIIGSTLGSGGPYMLYSGYTGRVNFLIPVSRNTFIDLRYHLFIYIETRDVHSEIGTHVNMPR